MAESNKKSEVGIMKNKISNYLKLAIFIASFSGVIWSFFSAEADGYSHWATRLLYFTAQSNIWIGLTVLILLIAPLIMTDMSPRAKNTLYAVRYVFTVSITLTAFIFCAVLAPTAHKGGYNAWTPASIITHMIVPTLAVVDFFLDTYRVKLSRSHVALSVVPPLIYLVFASILCILKVDFGRGDPFPYVFFNFYSPAGVFGFSSEMPYVIGSFYWMLFMLGIIIGVGAFYKKLYNKK